MISCLKYICALIVITFVVSLILSECFRNQENGVNIFRSVSRDEKVIRDMRLNVYIFYDLVS